MLGLFQGFLGWYMVKSGLSKDPFVSPYRLTMHLFVAFLLEAMILKTIYNLSPDKYGHYKDKQSSFWSWINLALVTLTLLYGGLVAGHKAGLIYNTFPTMEGQWYPSEWLHETPLWINFFKNHATIQFMHRMLAYAVVMWAAIGIWRKYIHYVYGLVISIQVTLGIVTLLLNVPVLWATLHQGWAVVVFSFAFWNVLSLKKRERYLSC
jgi:cytochrome c oxidase assembly protein subunit 15